MIASVLSASHANDAEHKHPLGIRLHYYSSVVFGREGSTIRIQSHIADPAPEVSDFIETLGRVSARRTNGGLVMSVRVSSYQQAAKRSACVILLLRSVRLLHRHQPQDTLH